MNVLSKRWLLGAALLIVTAAAVTAGVPSPARRTARPRRRASGRSADCCRGIT